MRKLLILLLMAIPGFLLSQICHMPPAGGEDCMDAPLMSCNLDGYMGSSTPFSPGPAPPGFCGIIENDQWFQFEVDELPVIIQITPSACRDNKGIQSAFYSTSDCITLSPVSNCSSFGNMNTLTVQTNTVSVGDILHFMIDGFEGDECDFEINVISGILSDAIAVANDEVLCAGQSISLDGSTSTTGTHLVYEWTTSNGNIVSGATNLNPVVDALGTYNLMVNDTMSCCFDNISVDVTADTNFPVIDFVASNTINCNNTSIVLDPRMDVPGNYTYNWTSVDGNIVGANNLSTASVDLNGTYDITVTNSTTGCLSIESVPVAIDTISPILAPTVDAELNCTTLNTNVLSNTTDPSLVYSWNGPSSFTSAAQNINVTNPGTYNVVVTASNGCTQSRNAMVSQNIVQPDITAVSANDLNCTNTSSVLDGSSTTVNPVFSWTGPNSFSSNLAMPTASDPGSYDLMVTAENGCTNTTSVLITQDIVAPNINIAPAAELNCSAVDVPLLGSSSTTNVSFAWTGPGGFTDVVAQPDVTQPGNYVLTITGQNGCTSIMDVDVSQDIANPVADAGLGSTLTCINTSANVGGSNTSVGNMSYEWTDNLGAVVSSNITTTVSSMSTYTLEVTDLDNGCTSTSDVIIDENVVDPVSDPGSDLIITCTDPTVFTNGTSTSSGPNFSYEWENASGVLYSTSMNANIAQPGIYSLIVTDVNNGCTATNDITIDIDQELPIAAPTVSGELTCAVSSVDLDIASSSVGSEFNYLWQDASSNSIGTSSIENVLIPGDYTLLVTNGDNGCSSSMTISVDEDINTPLIDVAAPVELDCNNLMIDLDGSASNSPNGLSSIWTDQGGALVASNSFTQVATPGNYTLVITDNYNGCTATETINVSQDITSPIADAGTNATINCNATTIDLGGASSSGANFTYEWTDGLGAVLSDQMVYTSDTPGDFSLTVNNIGNGCSTTASVTLDLDTYAPVADPETPEILNCINSQITLDGSNSTSNGNISYTWFDPSLAQLGTANQIDINNPGTYMFVVTDNAYNCADTVYLDVLQDIVAPVVNPGPVQTINCNIAEVTLDGTGSSVGQEYSYAWTNSSGSNQGTTLNFDVIEPGSYELMVTNTINGCTSASFVDVLDDRIYPVAETAGNELLTCLVSNVELDIAGSSIGTGLEYQWLDEDDNVLSTGTNINFSQPGIITLAVTNQNNGCVTRIETEIEQNIETPQADAGIADILTCTVLDISLDASLSSATGSMSYVWEDPLGNVISNTPLSSTTEPGLFTLLVTDLGNGCTDTETITIIQDIELPDFTLETPTNIDCNRSISTLSFESSNVLNPITAWMDDVGNLLSTAQIYNASSTGVYQLEVTDPDNGCTDLKQIEVFDDFLTPTIGNIDEETITCTNDIVDLEATVSNSLNNVSYSWSDIVGVSLGTDATLSVETPGVYFVTIENEDNGCTENAQVEVFEDKTPPEAIIAFDNLILDCNVETINMNGDNTTGVPGFDYLWLDQNGNTVSINSDLAIQYSGEYSLVVTQASNGCTNDENIIITEDYQLPILDFEAVAMLTCQDTIISVEAEASGANGIFSYEWRDPIGGIINGETTSNPEIETPGTYTFVATDQINGCQDSVEIVVQEDVILPDAIAAANEILDCITESVSLSLEGSDSGPNFSYLWTGEDVLSGANTNSPEVGTAGFYELEVTNITTGCENRTSVEVLENTARPTDVVAEITNPSCYGNSDGILDIGGVVGGTEPYLYALNNPNFYTSSTNINNLASGEYQLFIQDATGCEWDTSIYVVNPVPVSVDLGPDVILELGETALLNADVTGGIMDADWSSDLGDLPSGFLNVEVTPFENTEYTIVVSDEHGCTGTDNILVRIEANRNVFIPDIFSPNGDGINDFFSVFSDDKVTVVHEFKIFDKWGAELFSNVDFQTNIEQEGWNGLFKNKEMPPGVYAYYMRVEYIDGKTGLYQGNVTLVR